MTTNGAYRIGKAHSVCQDYVLSGSGERPFVLLSDGCSSSPDTDMGARLIVRSAAKIISANPVDPAAPDCMALAAYHQKTIQAARSFIKPLGLQGQCLDATLLTLEVGEGRWMASISGDGTLAMQDTDGAVHLRTVSYTRSYPFYLNYFDDPDRLGAFNQQIGNLRRTEHSILLRGGGVEVQKTIAELADTPPYCEWGKAQDFQWIALLSDGVGSFIQKKEAGGTAVHEPIPIHTVLRELLAFKNFNGVFVERRMQKFLRDCARWNWLHQDDISVGCLKL